MSIPENELVGLVQKDETDAFAELASRYLPLIHRIAYPYRSCLLETEDLSQEGLLGLFFAARTYHPEGTASFSTYAGICISNRIISAYRKAVRQKSSSIYGMVSLEEEAWRLLSGICSEGINPEELLVDRENLDVLLKKLQETLTEMEHRVLSCYAAGFSYQEISEKLGISMKSVGNAMQRARRKLRVAF